MPLLYESTEWEDLDKDSASEMFLIKGTSYPSYARDTQRLERRSWAHDNARAVDYVARDDLLLRQLRVEDVPAAELFNMSMAFAIEEDHESEVDCIVSCARKGYLPAQAICAQIVFGRPREYAPDINEWISQWSFNAVASGYLFSHWAHNVSRDEEFLAAKRKFRTLGGYGLHYCSRTTRFPIQSTLGTPDSNESCGLVGSLEEDLHEYPLHLASALDDLKDDRARRFLLGADIQAKDHWGDTPLMKCCMAGHIITLRTLVQNGADASLANEVFGLSPLHWLFTFDEMHIDEAAQLLREARVDLEGSIHSAAFKAFHFPFAWPSGSPLHWAVFANCQKAVRVLVQGGIDIDQKDTAGQTSLHIAMKMLNAPMVSLLLDLGANLFSSMSDNTTPLVTPVHNFLYAELRLGIDPEFEEFDDMEISIPPGYGSLLFANCTEFKGISAVLRALFAHSPACLQMKDADGLTPLHHYATFHRAARGVVDLLMKYSPQLDEIEDDEPSVLARLMAHQYEIYGDEGMNSFLTQHVGKLEPARRTRLLNRKEPLFPDVNKVTHDWRPLHWAANFGMPLCIKALLELGSDISVTTENGSTALDIVSNQLSLKRGVFGINGQENLRMWDTVSSGKDSVVRMLSPTF